jgi:hypothetical protein
MADAFTAVDELVSSSDAESAAYPDWVNPAIRKSPAIKLKIFFIILIFSFKIGF